MVKTCELLSELPETGGGWRCCANFIAADSPSSTDEVLTVVDDFPEVKLVAKDKSGMVSYIYGRVLL